MLVTQTGLEVLGVAKRGDRNQRDSTKAFTRYLGCIAECLLWTERVVCNVVSAVKV